MTETTGFPPPAGGVPDPAQNKADWFAAHPEAQPVSPAQAQEQTDPGSQEGPPSAVPTGQQMVDAGAHPGLPHEDQMDAMMAEIKRLSAQLGQLQVRDSQRQEEMYAQLGPPKLHAYSDYIADALEGHQAANPALGADHFAQVRNDAEDLRKAARAAVSSGGNEMGRVAYFANRIDHFLTKGHLRKAPAHIGHSVDLSAVGQALEYVLEEAERLAPGTHQLTG